MGTEIINTKVNELLGRYKDLPYDAKIESAINYLETQIRENPLIAIFHEMKKELIKRQKELKC